MIDQRILLRNIYHLYVGDDRRTRERGVDLLIEHGRIADIGARLPSANARVMDCSTKLVLPGLVNTHHHMYQTLTRALPATQDSALFEWLTGLYPVWSHLTAEAIAVSTQLACCELLKTGCTTTSDHHYVFPASVVAEADPIELQIAAAKQMGIRFCATRGSMSRGRDQGGLPPVQLVEDEAAILAHSERLIAAHHDADPFAMCRVALAPCSPFSVSEQLMRQTALLARRHGVRLHTHLAETLDEQAYCLKHYGCRPLELMHRWGWTGSDVWFAHGIHFDDSELALLAESGTGVAHCPSSNMRLGSGICRVPALIERDVRLGLAVDGSASNDSSNMLGELRACLLLARIGFGAGALAAEDVVSLATRGGAALLGWETIGSLEVGKAADLVAVEMDRVDFAGALSDPLAALLFCGISHVVDTTIVNGEIVVREGQLTRVDEVALRGRANALARRMVEAAGHDPQWML